jgi:hypothetical protein
MNEPNINEDNIEDFLKIFKIGFECGFNQGELHFGDKEGNIYGSYQGFENYLCYLNFHKFHTMEETDKLIDMVKDFYHKHQKEK